MGFLVLFICIGFSIGANARSVPNSEPTNETARHSDSPNEEQFEVISLDDHNSQEPLIIRSRIPDSLRITKTDLYNKEGTVIATPLTDQTLQTGRQYFNSFEANSNFFQHVPSPSLSLSDSTHETHLSSDDTGLNPLPVIQIESITDFKSILDSESSVGVGTMLLDAENQPNPETSFSIPEMKTSPVKLVPAELQFSSVSFENVGLPNSNVQGIFSQSQELLENNSSATSGAESGYVIEAVPVVASYIKPGPLTPSDIPSVAQIEAIFDITAHRRAFEHQTAQDHGLDIERRSDDLEINTTIANITDNITEPNDIVDITTPEDRIGKESFISNITSNEIDDDLIVVPIQPIVDASLRNSVEIAEELQEPANVTLNSETANSTTNEDSEAVLGISSARSSASPSSNELSLSTDEPTETTTLETSTDVDLFTSISNEETTEALAIVANETAVSLVGDSFSDSVIGLRLRVSAEQLTDNDLDAELSNDVETTTLDAGGLDGSTDVSDIAETTIAL